ncbi:MAG: hypothetical protein [Asgard archaea virus SkuldV2]|nr:MAG: hypothetical protein [Asgard archaea virus SkuldV2]
MIKLKIIQIILIVISMLLFLGCHLLQILCIYTKKVYYIGFLINLNILIEIMLFLAFLLLFAVIVLITIEKK